MSQEMRRIYEFFSKSSIFLKIIYKKKKELLINNPLHKFYLDMGVSHCWTALLPDSQKIERKSKVICRLLFVVKWILNKTFIIKDFWKWILNLICIILNNLKTFASEIEKLLLFFIFKCWKTSQYCLFTV